MSTARRQATTKSVSRAPHSVQRSGRVLPRSNATLNRTAGLQSAVALRALDQLSRQSPVPGYPTVGSGLKCELPVRPQDWDTDADGVCKVCEKLKSGVAGQSSRFRH